MTASIGDPTGMPRAVNFKITGLTKGSTYMLRVIEVATGKPAIDVNGAPVDPVVFTPAASQHTQNLRGKIRDLKPTLYQLELYAPGDFDLSFPHDPNTGASPESTKAIQVLSGAPGGAAPVASLVRLDRSASERTADEVLWELIDAWTTARRFTAYQAHIDQQVCRAPTVNVFGPGAYATLVSETRAFLATFPSTVDLQSLLAAYEDKDGNLPYLGGVVTRYPDAVGGDPCSDIDVQSFQDPFPVELIWSYWHEEGALVQTLNHILARFQNRRPGRGADPLARFDLNPLRPLRHILWAWAEDEFARLTVRRRAAEYEYEYGLALVGSAIPGSGLWAERRTKFLEAFHTLLHVCHRFFLQDDDTTVQSDARHVLNALKETHLVLSEGAHNQFGDLPTEARVQMLVMQWLLAQPEMREFLGGRPMVPYAEAWMDRVDTMKTIQGWTDTSVTHFRDLGVYGEQLLLSIRYGDWSSVIDPNSAKNWARRWRPEIQQYVHSYRAATGVDLTVRADASMPAGLLARRVVRAATTGVSGPSMTDFTSALFLGYRHATADLPTWASLTTGRPSAMYEPAAAIQLAARIARRQGSEAGVVHRSALHALWDVIDFVARPGSVVVLDRAAYPLSRWAAAGAVARGIPVTWFPHHGVRALRQSLDHERRQVIIVTDGWCPDCGQPAPLSELGQIAASRGGLLLVDDTLAAGVLGTAPTTARPFGVGGGGTLCWLGASPVATVQVASFAKAYGAPLAVTTGPPGMVAGFRTHGSRWHSSPPSAADLAAAEVATRDEGANDRRRQHLAGLVLLLREGLMSLGLPVNGRPFPMVSVVPPDAPLARALYGRLVSHGIGALLRKARCRDRVTVTFSVTAANKREDITQVIDALARAPIARLERAS